MFKDSPLTRFTASSHAFLSSVELLLFTLTSSLDVAGTGTDRGPTGLSVSTAGDADRLEESLLDDSVADFAVCFFEGAIIF